MFTLFLLCVFLSQFSYILEISFLNPGRILWMVLFAYDFIVHLGRIEKLPKQQSGWLNMLIIWVTYAVVSVLWAKDIKGTLTVVFVFLEAIMMIYYSMKLINTKEKVLRFMDTIICAALIHNVLCWIEILFKKYFFSIYTEKYIEKGYPVSTFTNTNNLAMYLLMVVMMIIFAHEVTRSKKRIVAYTVCLVSSLFMIIKTGSRGAIIALVVSVVLYYCLIVANKKTLIRLGVGAVAASLIIVLVPALTEKFIDVVQKAFDVDINAQKGTDFYRMNAYKNGLDFFVQTKGYGVSPGNVEYWMETVGERNTNGVKPLHNWWLEVLVSSGTLVFLLMVYTWLRYYWKLIRKRVQKGGSSRKYYSIAMTFGIAFCLGSLSPSSLYKVEWPWIFLAFFFSMAWWGENRIDRFS